MYDRKKFHSAQNVMDVYFFCSEACHVRIDSCRRVSGHTPAICRSIWYVLLYYPGPAAGHMYIPELFYLCLYGEVGWAGVRLELPLYPDHVVVGQPHCAMMV